MKAKIKTDKNVIVFDKTRNCLHLLHCIKGVAYKFETQGYLPQSLDKAKEALYLCNQGQNESNSAYLNQFNGIVDVISHYGSTIREDPALTWQEMKLKKYKVDEDKLPKPGTKHFNECTLLAKAT
jgi:hypothetical protein